ncbi:hypothetical protein HMPREF1544_02046 [Mucor circinelloides 1006PhL]|uniref:Uncharacterized protein n=1 Tax=Mucor circinelloides f. circinelloides (strain 1006PhL) TaxID=1220926 RepID=S2JLD5_MUCC1|nr:hypothetical protein HMPREF1544_02046 [Mucor circinelloides 1006PhL]
MAQTTTTPPDMSDMIHRLKARLALANFKREHGYENVDLATLESPLYEQKLRPSQSSPTSTTRTTTSPLIHDKKRRRVLSHHRFYPTSPPMQHNDMDRLIKKNASRSPSHIPLSETRSQHSPLITDNRKLSATLSSDDEDAAHLLVLMHQSPTMSS